MARFVATAAPAVTLTFTLALGLLRQPGRFRQRQHGLFAARIQLGRWWSRSRHGSLRQSLPGRPEQFRQERDRPDAGPAFRSADPFHDDAGRERQPPLQGGDGLQSGGKHRQPTDLQRRPDRDRQAAGQPIRLQAAFCRGGTLTSTNGWAPAVASPQDAAFRSLITDTTFELFLLRDPNRSDSNCGMSIGC